MKEQSPEFFMGKALLQAEMALRKDEVPIGAVLVDAQGTIIARAHNVVEHKKSQTAHAEVIAIERACKKRGDWRLDNCWLYVTLEPCLMCLGLMYLSRLQGVYFGAQSPLFGYRTYYEMLGKRFLEEEGKSVVSAYKKSLKIVGGIREQESSTLLKVFFKRARNGKG